MLLEKNLSEKIKMLSDKINNLKIKLNNTLDTIKKENKKFIAVWWHYDILEWLEPDWVFDTKDFVFTKGVRKPIKDPQLNVKWEDEAMMNGEYLANIII